MLADCAFNVSLIVTLSAVNVSIFALAALRSFLMLTVSVLSVSILAFVALSSSVSTLFAIIVSNSDI